MKHSLPAFHVRITANPGTHYKTHSLFVGDTCLRSQLGPFSDGEAERYVREYLAPAPAPQPLGKALTAWRSKPGPKKGGKAPHPWTDGNTGDDE